MKATIAHAGALLGFALATTTTFAAPYCSPVLHVYLPSAPDACGPGFYTVCPNGTVFGPNYWLRPPGEPFGGPSKTFPVNVGQKLMTEKLGPFAGNQGQGKGPNGAPIGPRPTGPYGPGGGGPGGPYAFGGPGGVPPQYPMNPAFPGGPYGAPTPYSFNPNLPNPGYSPSYVPNFPTPGYAPNLPTPGYNPNLEVPVYGAPPSQSPAGFPTHPYARSPRDFFMWRENMEDQMRRDQRPSLVP